MPHETQPDARPIFRWLAGLSCPVFVLLALITAFPQLVGGNDKPSIALAFLFVWGAICFGLIAATGRLRTGGEERLQLFIAAKKYIDGEMTLDEYGARTKQILNDE